MRVIGKAIDRFVEWTIVAIFLAMVIVGGFQVFNRFALNASISWSEEFQRYGQVWIVFLGIPVAYKRGMHIGMGTTQAMLTGSRKAAFYLFIDVLWCILGGIILFGIFKLSAFLGMQRSAGLGLPMTWAYAGMAIGAGYMIFVGMQRIVAHLRGRSADLPDWI